MKSKTIKISPDDFMKLTRCNYFWSVTQSFSQGKVKCGVTNEKIICVEPVRNDDVDYTSKGEIRMP